MPEQESDYRRRSKSSLQKAVDSAKVALGMFDIPDMVRYPVIGVDTSHWTKLFDWAKFRSRGGSFGIIKMLHGTDLDPWFEANYIAAKKAGVRISTYQWLLSRWVKTPEEQGLLYARMLKSYPVDFTPWVDFEKNDINPGIEDLRKHLAVFEAEYGDLAGIYTGKFYWEENGLPDPDWKKRRLWLAWYDRVNPPPPAPWERWDMHQFTERGDGVYWGSKKDGEKKIDINYFNGAASEFDAFCYTHESPVPVPGEPPSLPPTVTEELWFGGKARYQKVVVREPRLITYHLIKIRLVDIDDIVFNDTLSVTPTSYFLTKSNVDIAINGLDGWSSTKKGRTWVTSIGGFVAYKGKSYGSLGKEETLFIGPDKRFSLAKPQKIYSACSFPNCLIRDGIIQDVAFRDPSDIRARTAIGIDRFQTELTILLVDGGDYWEKRGMTFLETARVLYQNGAWLGIMGDGGGSTTGVKRNEYGLPLAPLAKIFNAPSGEGLDGQRPVAVKMGIKLKE